MTNDSSSAPTIHIKTRPVNYPARKRRIIVMLLAYSAIAGVIFIFLPDEDSPLDYVVGFPLLVLGIAWCFADADERQHRIGKLMRLVLVLAFFIGFPLYLLQTRGYRRVQDTGAGYVTRCRHVRVSLFGRDSRRCISAMPSDLSNLLNEHPAQNPGRLPSGSLAAREA